MSNLKELTREEIASLLDISTTMITNLSKQPGFPKQGGGRKGVAVKYDGQDVIKWYLDYKIQALTNKNTEITPKEKLEMDKTKEEIMKLKLYNSQKAQELLPYSAVELLLVDILQANNAAMENLSSVITARLVGVQDKVTIKKTVQECCDNVLDSFSNSMSTDVLRKIADYKNLDLGFDDYEDPTEKDVDKDVD